MTDLIFATHNNNKLQEVIAMCELPTFRIKSLSQIGFMDEMPENEPNLEGNSLVKAQTIYNATKSNVFSDDTGLEVYALNGRPGVHSARYAGEYCSSEDNMSKLIQELDGSNNRKARFRTVVTLIMNGKVEQFEGIVEGEISEVRMGAEGFGYDPIFIPEGHSRSFAQMSPDEKNSISHRKKALQRMLNYLRVQ